MNDKDKKPADLSVKIAVSESDQSAFEQKLGITQDYNSENRAKLWDSAQGKKEFKNKAFGDKETYQDKITGKILHKSHEAAKKKYHAKNADGEIISAKYAEHAADIDHDNSLKSLHAKTQKNAFMTDEDLKRIANKPHNYRVISKRLNTSKGEKSDYRVAWEHRKELGLCGTAELIKGKARADVLVNADIALTTAKNAGGVFAKGAQVALDVSIIPLVIKGSQDFAKVANGDMSEKEAIEDIGSVALHIAAVGGSQRVAIHALSSALKNNHSKVLQAVSKTNQVGNIIIIASIVTRAATKCLNGESTVSEFFSEISQDGLSFAAGLLGADLVAGATAHTFLSWGIAGAAVPALGAMIASAACAEIYSQAKKIAAEEASNAEIRFIAEDAKKGMAQQQKELESLMEKDHISWAQEMLDNFQQIAEGIINSDIDSVNDGLTKIANHYSSSTLDLYDNGDSVLDDLCGGPFKLF